MTSSISYQALLLFFGLCSAPLVVQALEVPQFMPGNWEIASAVRAKGKEPLVVPPRSGGCFDPSAIFKRDLAAMEEEDGCKIKLISKSRGEYRYRVRCAGRESAGTPENRLPVPLLIVIRTADVKSFSETVFFNAWKTVVSARWVGECEENAQSGVGEK
jgi:hypothetical protein